MPMLQSLLTEDIHSQVDIVKHLSDTIKICTKYDTNDLAPSEKTKFQNMIKSLYMMMTFVKSLEA